MRTGWLAAALGIVILGLGAAGAFLSRRTPPKAQPKVETKPVEAVPSEINLSGKILAVKIVEVKAPMNGILDKEVADVGDDVFEGQVLAHIRNPRLESSAQNTRAETEKLRDRVNELQSALLTTRLEASRSRSDAVRARLELERAGKAYKHQQELMDAGATPRLVFEKAQQEYNSQKSDLETTEALAAEQEDRVATLTKELTADQNLLEKKQGELEDTGLDIAAANILSPTDGVIVARHAQPGEQINRVQPNIFEIGANLDNLQVGITIANNAKLLASLHKGQAAAIEIAEVPGSLPGTVREIKGTQVFVEFSNPSPIIRPGLTAQVKIKL